MFMSDIFLINLIFVSKMSWKRCSTTYVIREMQIKTTVRYHSTPIRMAKKLCVHTKTCTQMFIVILFIISKTWKQPRCPLAIGWINKLWCIQSVEYYSALKRNKLSSHERTWKLKCIRLSDKSQSEKATYCMISTL